MNIKREFSEKFNEFIKIQNENQLSEIQIDDVYIWRLIRAPLFTKILETEKLILEPEKKSLSKFQLVNTSIISFLKVLTSIEKWKRFPDFILNFKSLLVDIINIVPSLLFTARLLFFGSSKKKIVSAFIRNIGAGHKITRPIEQKYKGNYLLLDKPNAGLFMLERLDTRAFNILSRWFFKIKIKDRTDEAITKISSAYNIDRITVERLVRKQLKAFKSNEAAFLHLFNKSNFDKIYLCWNRYYMPLLSAAKKSGIETSEFQHGTITPYHIMYAWEGYGDVPYYPDRLLCFGPSWPAQSNLGASITPVVIGAQHLEIAKSDHTNEKRDANKVVVFSQNVIGIKLLRFSIEVARIRPDLDFIFKPHPAERYIDITEYIEGKIPDNFTLALPTDDSYKLMASATYQIGVSSTTLNEGMFFGNRIIVVPFASWEYLEPAIKLGHASLAETPQKAAKLLSLETPQCDQPEYYYAPVDLSNL